MWQAKLYIISFNKITIFNACWKVNYYLALQRHITKQKTPNKVPWLARVMCLIEAFCVRRGVKQRPNKRGMFNGICTECLVRQGTPCIWKMRSEDRVDHGHAAHRTLHDYNNLSSGAEASDLHAARKLPDTLSGGSFKRVKIYRGCLTEGAV